MPNRLIVLVEDNADDEELTLRALKKARVDNPIKVVRDGAEALDFFFCRGAYAERSPHEVILLVMLDLKLPKIDGLEVLRALRADDRTRLVPIVILTSSNEEQDRLAGYDLGANSYVCKPVDFVQFADAVGQLGLYWLLINQPAPPR
jgi:two-component system response regulator